MIGVAIQVQDEPAPLPPGELLLLLETEVWPLIPGEMDGC
jgi:hypothetical protein